MSDKKDSNKTMNDSDKKRELLKKLLLKKAKQIHQAPASCAQRRLWIVNRIEAPNPSYNIPVYVALTGELDVDVLAKSFNQLLQRHASLRTTFKEENGTPFQVIVPKQIFHLMETDLSQVSIENSKTEIKAAIFDEIMQLFDLEKGPLLRAKLLKLGGQRHILVLTLHHIIGDGWSVGVLLKDLFGLYSAQSTDNNSPTKLPIQYVDYASRQSRWLASDDFRKQLDYWVNQLNNLPLLELPVDGQRPLVKAYQGQTLSIDFGQTLSQKLKELSEQEGVTLYMLLMSAFGILLQRYSGQSDVVFGTPIANRNQTDIEGLIGFFVNMLVMRTDLSGDPSFSELLKKNSGITLAAYANQDVPFDMLVDALKPERDPSRNPLFQAVFALQNESLPAIELDRLSVSKPVIPGYDVSEYGVNVTMTRFDIELHCWEDENGIRGQWIYDTALFDDSNVDRMSKHFVQLLSTIVENPNQKISKFSLLTSVERNQLLMQWGKHSLDYPKNSTVHELFQAQAARTPNAIAVKYGEEQLSYEALNHQANRLALSLQAKGVGPDVPVGICMERSTQQIAAMLGILKAGGAYLPLDAEYPQRRLKFMLDDTEAPVLITQSSLKLLFPDYEGHVIDMDEDHVDLSRMPSIEPNVKMDASNLAYIIYTSGSTGTPKGVAVPHRGVVRLTTDNNYVQIGENDRLVQASNTSFDAATFEIWSGLLNGAQVIGVARETTINSHRYAKFLAEEKITIQFLTTALFNQIIKEAPRAFRGLRALLFGGEAVDVDNVRTLLTSDARPQRLLHVYGPTESTTFAAWFEIEKVAADATTVPIGGPIANSKLYVLDKTMQLVPVGVEGELYIGGDGLARDYWQRPDLTAEKFVANPFGDQPHERLYRSGDLVKWNDDGAIEFVGRVDHQVKLRGFRIELGEIDARIRQFENVRYSYVMLREDTPGNKRLVAYFVTDQDVLFSIPELKTFIQEELPDYMMPSVFMPLDELPLTPNGKVDRKLLPEPTGERQLDTHYIAPKGDLETDIADIWKEVLGLQTVGVEDKFFDLGGHSLLLAKVHARLQELMTCDIPMVELFQYTTIKSLAMHLGNQIEDVVKPVTERTKSSACQSSFQDEPIAVIGLAGRFPGAENIEQFWDNLRNGVDSIRNFTEEELREAGVPEHLLADPNYIKAKGYMEGGDLFDAGFFAYSPRELELMDPQQRVFLELAWEALECAGYEPEGYLGRIGVYAGSSENTYWPSIMHNPEMQKLSGFQTTTAAGKDFLASRVAYKMNLRGPAITLQTACSTSLVAVHEACKSLLGGECDIAMAGGVRVSAPLQNGYLYEPESILSPDGHCRAFDVDAKGTLGGDGVGIVVLKRLSEAQADGDMIHAVIRGSAINNDGSQKIGYTAPSVEGQSAVIAKAMVEAGVEPSTIDYIETHGTGTNLGDPIEIAALKKAFAGVEEKNKIAVGSLKTNVGHLDAAAGVSGLIKTILALKHKQFPPSLHFDKPNPGLHIEESPFYVNAALHDWPAKEEPRRAGISSFGIGGTNAHVILEEAPELPINEQARQKNVLLLSARSKAGIEKMSARLAMALKENPGLDMADVAYTLQIGRKRFNHTYALVCGNRQEAIVGLENIDATCIHKFSGEISDRSVVFMFPGQGSQYINMTKGLYETEPFFKQQVDACCELLSESLGCDLREIIYPYMETDQESASEKLKQTEFTQPALFVISYAVARLWMHWGVQPATMIGHSIGEYVAACLAGVMSLDDALYLVVHRGRLMSSMPAGSMLAVSMSPEAVEAKLSDELSIATVNGPSMTVVAGPTLAIEALQAQLTEEGMEPRLLHTSHAFHSSMMEPMLDEFVQRVAAIELKKPQLPYLSNVSGDWISDEQAVDPFYYAQHLRKTVHFSKGLEQLFVHPDWLLLEVGPGQVLSTLAKRHPSKSAEQTHFNSVRHPGMESSDQRFMLNTVGQLWAAGVSLDWQAFYAPHTCRRVMLPGYVFDHQRYWIEPNSTVTMAKPLVKRNDISEWFYTPSWQRSPLPVLPLIETEKHWLLFADDLGCASAIAKRLRENGAEVTCVIAGERYASTDELNYIINPQRAEDYEQLLVDLVKAQRMPENILHCWLITQVASGQADCEFFKNVQDRGFYSLTYLVQALGNRGVDEKISLTTVTTGVHDVNGIEVVSPEKATVLGPCRVIPTEYSQIDSRNIDIVLSGNDVCVSSRIVSAILADASSDPKEEPVVAYRGIYRWVQSVEQVDISASPKRVPSLRQKGTYLITGGQGGVGFALAEHLAKTVQANLVLLGRSALPERKQWQDYLVGANKEDGMARRIRQILDIESKYNVNILPVSADVADYDQMVIAVDRAKLQFGPIHGVIHGAGVPGGGILQLQTPETVKQVFLPKINGTLVLDKIFSNESLDFMVLFSSLITFLGLPGRAEYLAANAFVDSFVHLKSRNSSYPVIAVNWDSWVEVGMAVTTRHAEMDAEEGMLTSEGIEAFSRILNSDVPQVVVSVRRFDPRELERTMAELSAEGVAPTASKTSHSRPELGNDYIPPLTDAETVLTNIWQDLLGIDPIGVTDNFFALGGDSVITIQVIALARQAGVVLTPKDTFKYQTIQELALAADNSSDMAEVHIAVDSALLTPIQSWFFEQNFHHPDHFNQATMLEIDEPMEELHLRAAVQKVIERHDALRTCFVPDAEGEIHQRIGAVDAELAFEWIDISGFDRSMQRERIESEANRLQRTLNISKGPIYRIAYFDRGAGQSHRLLIIIHHLIIDAVAWRIIIEDLQMSYAQINAGESLALPASSASFALWSQKLNKYAQSAAVRGEVDYWSKTINQTLKPLPQDHPDGGNTLGMADTVHVELDIQQTKSLLQNAPQAYRTQINDLFLIALSRVFKDWTGQNELFIDMEGHGRDINIDNIDISRTVGWFTTVFPMRIDLPEGVDLSTQIKSVKEQVRAVPNHGANFGVLRYLNQNHAIKTQLRAITKPEVVFLYLGRFDHGLTGDFLSSKDAESTGLERSELSDRGHILEITAVVAQERLRVMWRYSTEKHERALIEKLAQEFMRSLNEVIKHCSQATVPSFTPSDFPAARISQAMLDQLISSLSKSK